MPFTNPIVAGLNLIRQAIRSPDYSAGVSGWSINRDGSAEFNDVTVRGDFLVEDPNDESYLWLYHETTDGVVVELRPADDGIFGAVTTPARLRAGADTTGASTPGVVLAGPDYNNNGQSTLFLGRRTGLGTLARLVATAIGFNASNGITLTAPNINAEGSFTVTGTITHRYVARVTRATTQAAGLVDFTTASTNNGGLTLATLPSTAPITIPVTGMYRVFWKVGFTSGVTGGTRLSTLVVNGIDSSEELRVPGVSTAQIQNLVASSMREFTAGDTLGIRVTGTGIDYASMSVALESV